MAVPASRQSDFDRPVGESRIRPIARRAPFKFGDVRDALTGRGRYPLNTWGGATLREALIGGGDILVQTGQCPAGCQRKRWGVWLLRVQSNGARIAALHCLVCGYNMRDIGASKIPGNLPLLADTTSTDPCEHCGVTSGVELHHWAPRHLFDDADAWPTSWLCPTCHRLWHSIVTPTMGRRSVA